MVEVDRGTLKGTYLFIFNTGAQTVSNYYMLSFGAFRDSFNKVLLSKRKLHME